MHKFILPIAFNLLFGLSLANAQTFTGTGGVIPDISTSYFDINVTGVPSVLDTSYGLESVCIDINHTRTGDLNIYLVSPDGAEVELSTGNGGTGNDFDNTCFSDDIISYIQNGSPPYPGNYHPEGAVSYVNTGQNGNGLWRLRISDVSIFGSGSVISWQLTFGSAPSLPFSSNLPIVKLTTFGQLIPDDPKILIHLDIIDNGPGIRNFINDSVFNYSGWAGIEVRGSSSQQFPKKSYGFETTDSLLNDTSISLLGMPAESDWILNANYTDKTFIRNVLAYSISEQMGHYATRWKYCELFRDGQYRGIYILSEKIKRDNNRVDIAKLTAADTTGDDLTGGYIIKIDKSTGSGGNGWSSSFSPVNAGPNPQFQYEYPDPDEILPIQENYIQNYIDSFEIVLNSPLFTDPVAGYWNRIDVNSFIDYFLVNEISKNVDGYRISTFLQKDKDSNGGFLKMGPVWDFDIAWGNADYYNGYTVTGWSYQFGNTNDDNQVPFWWDRMLQDSRYSGELKCRWETLRAGLLSTSGMHAIIDSLAISLEESQQRNFQRWPILGVQVWPNPLPVPTDYPGVIDELKNFIDARLSFLDVSMPGTCTTNIAGYNSNSGPEIRIYPNPSQGTVNIYVANNADHLVVYSLQGEKVHEAKLVHPQLVLNFLVSGMYVFEFSNGLEKSYKKVIVNR